ncbi:MAG: B12-binding domain-containing radical SAM protein [bacterium]|nr:B12-binding domain-containing radical SAM protein [bacterium]
MKILLINPPRSPHNMIYEHAPEDRKRFVHAKVVGPPLGLLTLAAAVPDHDVTILDMKGEYDLNPDAPAPEELALQWLQDVNPGIVGVTFIASEHPAGMDILRAVKRARPDVVTVAGGPHATLAPEDFNDPAVDVLCEGQATASFRAIVSAMESGASLDGIGTVGNDSAPDFPSLDRGLVQRWVDTYRIGQQPGLSTYVITSLGCPSRCSFCSVWPQFRGGYFQRDAGSVVDELRTLDDYAAVRFADANTLRTPAFAEQLFDQIVAEGLDSKAYVMDIRVDTAARNPELIAKLARGGLKVAISGFESFRESDLKAYAKNTSVELIREAVRVFHDNGVLVRSVYIIPPDFTEDDFRALADFVQSMATVLPAFTILTPIPGTVMYEQMRDRIVDHDLAKYNFLNCVLRTTLPVDKFYEETANLLPEPKAIPRP